MKKTFLFLQTLFTFVAASYAQEFRVAQTPWEPNGMGNHRVVVQAAASETPVYIDIPWRRTDENPEQKLVRVFNGAGAEVLNVKPFEVTAEKGRFLFEAKTAGTYYFYYLPFNAPTGYFDDPGTYFPPNYSADPAWLAKHGLNGKDVALDSLAKAQVEAIESRDQFESLYPMGVPMTAQEKADFLTSHRGGPLVLVGESHEFPITKGPFVPMRWKEANTNELTAHVRPGEVFAFQVGVIPTERDVVLTGMHSEGLLPEIEGGKKIPVENVHPLNFEAIDYQGKPFAKTIKIPTGIVQPLWVIVEIPADASGKYGGVFSIQGDAGIAGDFRLNLDVSGAPVVAKYDDPASQSRLLWLNSTMGQEEASIRPFTGVKEDGNLVSILNRTILFGKNGLPDQITSNGKAILDSPVTLNVETAQGTQSFKVIEASSHRDGPALLKRTTKLESDAARMEVSSAVGEQGQVDFSVTLTAKEDLELRDVSLTAPVSKTIGKYSMGLGRQGGKTPDQWVWRWRQNKASHMCWLGDGSAGLQVKLKPDNDDWSSNIDELARVGVPDAWNNSGKGGAFIAKTASSVVFSAWSGDRFLKKDESHLFRFRLLVTPFKPYDPTWWSHRRNHEDGRGGNIGHLHQSWTGNLWINYPFLDIPIMNERLAKMSTDLYYTNRELSNRAPELLALRSLGNEILSNQAAIVYLDKVATFNKSGGGYPWLREHLHDEYVPGWRQKVDTGEFDASVAINAASRWDNYYVEGLDWLLKNTPFDGLFLDGWNFGSHTMRRIARVMQQNREKPRIVMHVGNYFEWADARGNGLNLNMEHLPYATDLWVGEGYDLINTPPDYLLTEVSGIPFGVKVDMLSYAEGGNPWRGMLFGMVGLHKRGMKAGASLWEVWDDFGIQDAEMLGWWDERVPVKTGREDVLATVYRKKDKVLVAIGSWSAKNEEIELQIDWKSLGLDPDKVQITAPRIPYFQSARSFAINQKIPVKANEGWLLQISKTNPKEIKQGR